MGDVERVGRRHVRERRVPGDRRGVGADGVGDLGGAEFGEQAHHEPVRERRRGGVVEERHDRRGAVLGDRRADLRGDQLQSVVPADRFEGAGSLGAGASQRGEDPLRGVHPSGGTADLGADPAVGQRVGVGGRCGVDPDDPLAAPGRLARDVDSEGAGVGAVERARGDHGPGHGSILTPPWPWAPRLSGAGAPPTNLGSPGLSGLGASRSPIDSRSFSVQSPKRSRSISQYARSATTLPSSSTR